MATLLLFILLLITVVLATRQRRRGGETGLGALGLSLSPSEPRCRGWEGIGAGGAVDGETDPQHKCPLPRL